MILIESTMKYILTFILSFLSFLVCSQNITITDIPTIDQLPVNAIHRVFRDSEGYMWYGTVNGLCRDDGYHVKVFRSDIDTPGLLEDNLVECIAEDKKGNIWFGTDKGAYILNKSDYSVHPIDPKRLKNIPVMYLYATSDGSMWLGYRSVLAKYDTNGQLLKNILSGMNTEEPPSPDFVRVATMKLLFLCGMVGYIIWTKKKMSLSLIPIR